MWYQARRNLIPNRVVWLQDDVLHARFYWLAVPRDQRIKGAQVIAKLRGQTIDLEVSGPSKIHVRINDEMLALDRPISVRVGSRIAFRGPLTRTIAVLAKTLQERGDRRGMFSAEVTVSVP
ncbi:MAG: hypothetical protein V3W41_16605 [Planctomycetota bacterium]